MDKFDTKLDLVIHEIIDIRRHIHAHPELSGLEHQTAILIAGYLRNIGWEVKESIGKTGIIAEFGPGDNGYIGLRVDMDALPIHENTNLDFSSTLDCLLYTSPSPRDGLLSRMPSSA